MKPILTVCAEAAVAASANAAARPRRVEIFIFTPPKWWRILTDDPCPADLRRQFDCAAANGEACCRTTREEGFRMTARQAVAGNRGRGGRFPFESGVEKDRSP